MKTALFTILGLLALTTGATAAVIVDDFTASPMSASACAPPLGSPGVSSGPLAATNTISGERAINSQVSALLGTQSGCSTASVGGGVLAINTGRGVFGRTLLTWDIPGSRNAASETLFSIDLAITDGVFPNDTNAFTVQFCSDDACINRYTRSWSITGDVSPAATYQFALSGFVASGAPSWATITKASFQIDSGNSSDLVIDNILLTTSNIPEPSSLFLLGGALAGLAFWRRR